MSSSVFGDRGTVAYFSMEFGIHESRPLFAGGLGVLAGDHLKSASDMRVPLAGVGLYYRQGYFHQHLDYDGYQQETYPRTDIYSIPLESALDPQGNEVRISFAAPDGEIHAKVWKLNIGRILLYLLDANIRDNPPEIRDITSFEPCGLPQMIAPIYGTLPVVHDTGGIHDKICHLDVSKHVGNGFLFEHHNAAGLSWAIDQAMVFYQLLEKSTKSEIRRIMNESIARFNHSVTARQYIDLYEKMLQRPLID